ncbi:hypothetical protein B0H63DRAFT_455812 [Podospora didyma]|uniref:Uncharacterized protein n=1 Tax=Podospora didyma TaxID=330526 RepID=A0AAE0K127_9PEZI|nr:hypothetical protein B0H63DRAFT_455812 [Podospora didyma]
MDPHHAMLPEPVMNFIDHMSHRLLRMPTFSAKTHLVWMPSHDHNVHHHIRVDFLSRQARRRNLSFPLVPATTGCGKRNPKFGSFCGPRCSKKDVSMSSSPRLPPGLDSPAQHDQDFFLLFLARVVLLTVPPFRHHLVFPVDRHFLVFPRSQGPPAPSRPSDNQNARGVIRDLPLISHMEGANDPTAGENDTAADLNDANTGENSSTVSENDTGVGQNNTIGGNNTTTTTTTTGGNDTGMVQGSDDKPMTDAKAQILIHRQLAKTIKEAHRRGNDARVFLEWPRVDVQVPQMTTASDDEKTATSDEEDVAITDETDVPDVVNEENSVSVMADDETDPVVAAPTADEEDISMDTTAPVAAAVNEDDVSVTTPQTASPATGSTQHQTGSQPAPLTSLDIRMRRKLQRLLGAMFQGCDHVQQQ